MATTVTNNSEENRYEVHVDGGLAGFAIYEPLESQWAFVHTEIDPGFAGQGLGSVLIRGALDDVRSKGIGVLPFCPFVHAFIEKNADYLDLVPAWSRARFGYPLAEQKAL